MQRLTRTLSLLRPSHALLLMIALAPPIAVLVSSYADQGRISNGAVFFSIGAAAGGVILVTLLLLARRILPPARNRIIISMVLEDVIYEYVYLGYKVEAMTDNAVVLVRIRIVALVFLIFLAIIAPTLVFFRLVAMKVEPESYGLAALFLSMVSLFAVAFFVIAGYGFHRLVYFRTSNPGETAGVADSTSSLPHRIKCSITAQKGLSP